MSLITLMEIGGGLFIYYVIEYSEVTLIHDASDALTQLDANAWISGGSSLSVVSASLKAIKDIISDFNDFMDDIFSHPEYGLFKDFYDIDPVTGQYVLKDFVLKLPNGLVFKIIDGGQLQSFRFSTSALDWKGASIGIKLPVVSNFQLKHTYYRLAFRLVDDPRFPYHVAGSDELNFVDFDGNIRQGKYCTPHRWIEERDIEYCVSAGYVFGVICDVLYKLGLFKVLNSWVQKYMLRRSISRISKLEQKEVDQLTAMSKHDKDFTDLFLKQWFGDLDIDANIVTRCKDKILKSHWRPYG